MIIFDSKSLFMTFKMQHLRETFQFDQIKPFDQLIFDNSLASDESRADDLMRFVRTYYKSDYEEFHYEQYRNMIKTAIKSNNLRALEILWQGIYYHDVANPDYESNLLVAAEFSNLRTFQHVIYACMNYRTLNYSHGIKHKKLKELALKNPDQSIANLVNALKICVNSEGKLIGLYESAIDDPDSDEEEYIERTKKFYELMAHHCISARYMLTPNLHL